MGARPITDIRPEECAAAIRAIVKRGSPYQAFNALGHLRRIFSWAIGTNEFGMTVSPVESIRPADLIGKRKRGPASWPMSNFARSGMPRTGWAFPMARWSGC